MRQTRGLGGVARVARRLRREAFDLAVSPHRSLRTALVLAAARIPRRIGFADSRGAFLFHERVPRDRRRHDVERNLALVAPFGGSAWPAAAARPGAARGGGARRDAAAGRPRPAGRARAGIGVGDEALAPGRLRRRAARLPRPGARASSCSARPTSATIAEDVVRRAGGGATVLAGRTDLATLVAVIDRLALLVANDSAPMHVACARDVPVVAVFCATTPALGYGPWGPRSAVVEADLACRPCGRHGGRRCPRGTEDCMRLVRAEAVLAAARRPARSARTAGSAA